MTHKKQIKLNKYSNFVFIYSYSIPLPWNSFDCQQVWLKRLDCYIFFDNQWLYLYTVLTLLLSQFKLICVYPFIMFKILNWKIHWNRKWFFSNRVQAHGKPILSRIDSCLVGAWCLTTVPPNQPWNWNYNWRNSLHSRETAGTGENRMIHW